MPAKLPRHLERAALAFVDLFDGGQAPKSEFQIFGPGVNSSAKGDFLFDDQAAAQVMAAYREHGVDLAIDYDHHTLYVSNGVKAVAAGWFGIEVRDGALWASNVRWNPPALEHFSKGEYRYFSPLFDYDKKTGRIEKLINNALLNTPALFGIDALMAASAHTNTKEDTVDPELQKALDRAKELERQLAASNERVRALEGQSQTAALSTTIGLAATAGAEEIRTRVAALSTFQKDVLAIAGKDSTHLAIAALTAMKEQAGEVSGLREQVEAAQTAALSAEFKSYLDGLSTKGADGKCLPPASRQVAEKMALSIGGGKLTKNGIEAAKEFIAPMMRVADSADEGDKSSKSRVALSAIEIEIAKNTGSSTADLVKHKERRLAGQ